MASPFVVAWLDAGSRVGIRPRCIPGGVARNAAACDLTPVEVSEAAGKACASCGEPLVGDARVGSRVLLQEYLLDGAGVVE